MSQAVWQGAAPFEPPTVRTRVRSMMLSGMYVAARVKRAVSPRGRDAHRLRALLYHDVAPEDEAVFAAHLRRVARRWRFVTAAQFAEMAMGQAPVTADSVLLTFDDGFASNLRVAERVLKPLQIPALFFVVNGFISLDDDESEYAFIAEHIWPGIGLSRVPAAWRSMTWDDLARLVSLGHTIGAHTMSHARLSDLTDESVLRREIAASGEQIAAALGVRVEHFAFPFGNAASISPLALRIAGEHYPFVHSGLRGSNSGRAAPRLVARDAVSTRDSPVAATAFLEGVADQRHAASLRLLEQWFGADR